jgi:hypothetical protein
MSFKKSVIISDISGSFPAHYPVFKVLSERAPSSDLVAPLQNRIAIDSEF